MSEHRLLSRLVTRFHAIGNRLLAKTWERLLGKFEWLRGNRSWAAIAGLAIAGSLIFFPEAIRDRYEVLIANYWSSSDGLILLDTPQVFTRRRLVNDRSIESSWLIDRLDQTNKLLDDDRFARPGLIRTAQRRLTAMLNQREPAGGGRSQNDLMKRLADLDLRAPPIDQFEDARSYREAIRNSILSTALDDRHDIDGNTLYRLNFSAAVLPPMGSSRVAAVVIQLSEAGSRKALTSGMRQSLSYRDLAKDGDMGDETETNNRYVELLYDWAEKLAAQVKQAIDERSDIIERGTSLGQREELEFRSWSKRQIDSLISDHGIVNSDDLFREFAVRYSKEEFTLRKKDAKDQVSKQIALMVSSYLNPSLPLKDEQVKAAADQCAETRTVDLQSFGAQGAMGSARFQPCPQFSDISLGLSSDLKIALIFIDALRLVKLRGDVPERCTSGREQLLKLLIPAFVPTAMDGKTNSEDIAKVDEHPQANDNCEIFGASLGKERNSTDSKRRRRAIIASFNAANLKQKKATTDLGKALKGREFTLGDIFDVTLPELCSLGDCDPAVMPRKRFFETLSPNLRDLRRALDERTNAFTYGVVPSKTVDRVEVQDEAFSDVGASTKESGPLSGVFGASSSSGAQGVERSATILGFGDWGTTKPSPRTLTKFGWVMFPKPNMLGTPYRRQRPEQFSVSALVSIPGWWKSAHLDVSTCWIAEASLREGVDVNNLCPDGSPIRQMEMRLPADAETLGQNLRFFVVTYPYIAYGQPEPEVEVGRPAKIAILGGRLWQSPIVKLGSQQATSIEVLPDMRGINAYFNCVLPEPGKSGAPTQGSRSPAAHDNPNDSAPSDNAPPARTGTCQ